ncbi:MAG: carbon starvation protein A [Bacteroidales bacterium]|nr:carbon starvation protein A [Bacteroidales bacterium]
MITFTICLLLLIAGYFIYGAIVEKVVGYDYSKKTPAIAHPDGVDYLPLPTWKVYMIQFLNIAGLGPIFGAIMGAKFGTASYIWIVLGTIFAGAVHDYVSAMMSLEHDGESLPEIIGRYLGLTTKKVFGVFTIVLMILVGAVFISGPAELLAQMTPDWMTAIMWIVIIFVYYILATMLPIDKIIGRFYPIFAIALIFMAVGILYGLYANQPELPEMWEGFGTKYETHPIFPMMFVSIACGAISGFHATQSPLMARCLKDSKHGRRVFYGAMVTEGIVALIWAAAATAFFGEHGVVDANGNAFSGAAVAKSLSVEWLGTFGSILAILGIVAAPITSGDTALRSARLIVADFLHFSQKTIMERLKVSLPIFVVTFLILLYSLSDKEGFGIIWRYFAWSNQTLAVFTLWSITVYFTLTKRPYVMTLIPALWMTAVCTTYIFVAPECLGNVIPQATWLGPTVGGVAAATGLGLFWKWKSGVK